MCSNWRAVQKAGIGCDQAYLAKHANDWLSSLSSTGSTVEIDYCLSKKVQESCTVEFSVAIMIAVIVANAIKACCMLYTLRIQRANPLVTLGDAVQSFLTDNDATTANRCLADRSKFPDHEWVKPQGITWASQRYRWFSGASKTRWFTCNIL